MATFDVLMPVKNGLPYLRDAIESIRQQSFTDWRMFVLDHASTDGSVELAYGIAQADPRVVVISCPAELTFSALLNAGLDRCDARYVLRQDADDISLPHRMAVLAAAFEADPQLVLLGSQGNVIDGAGRVTGRFRMPVSPQRTTALAFFQTPVLHPAAALRWSEVERRGVRYGLDFVKAVPQVERLDVSGLAEDYFMFGQLALTARCRNVNDRLLNLRWHGSNTSVKKQTEQTRMAIAISRYLARTFSLLKDLPVFDPAPFCNHGYRLVHFRDRDDFSQEFEVMRANLVRGLGASRDLEQELGFRRCFARRKSLEMATRYALHAARHGIERSEWYTLKSWVIHQSRVGYLRSAANTLYAMD